MIIDSADMAAGSSVVTESDLRMPSARQVIVLTTHGLERRDAAGYSYRPTDGLTTRATTSQLAHLYAEPTDEVILFTSAGRAWRNKVGFVPDKATPIQLGLAKDESLVGLSIIPADDAARAALRLVFATRHGRIKRTEVTDLTFLTGNWATVCGLPDDGDEVLAAAITGDGAEVLFGSRGGYVLRTSADGVNPQASGSARGVAGVGPKAGDAVVSGCIGNPWIFRQARAMLAGRPALAPTIAEQRAVLLEHFELSVAVNGENLASRTMRKFGIRFAEHHPKADEVRRRFIAVSSLEQWRAVLAAECGSTQMAHSGWPGTCTPRPK